MVKPGLSALPHKRLSAATLSWLTGTTANLLQPFGVEKWCGHGLVVERQHGSEPHRGGWMLHNVGARVARRLDERDNALGDTADQHGDVSAKFATQDFEAQKWRPLNAEEGRGQLSVPLLHSPGQARRCQLCASARLE